MEDATRKFTAIDNKTEMREILTSVYNALVVKGYNPINQLVGYILSEDPTYITNYNNARSLICRIDRDELLQELLETYIGKEASCPMPNAWGRVFVRLNSNQNHAFLRVVLIFLCKRSISDRSLLYLIFVQCSTKWLPVVRILTSSV